MILLRQAAYKQMPWKNGRGTTAEIDRFPSSSENYLWRLSQALIHSDGPFSEFPGYDRWLAVWQGDGLILGEQNLKPLEPFRFCGDSSTECRLIGKQVLDVGLIFDRTRIRADMRLVEGSLSLAPAQTHYVFDLASGDTMKIDSAVQSSFAKSFLISVQKIAVI
jgi:environmental stress-induced protein Ves